MNLFERLRNAGLISEVVIDTYEREIVRYGGTQLIENAEKYFFYDSRAVMKIIYMQQLKKEKFNLEYIGVIFYDNGNGSIPFISKTKRRIIMLD